MHASAELLVASAMRDASNNRIQCLVLDHQCVFGISCQNGREKMVKQQIKQKAPATCMYTYAPQHVLSVVHLFGSWLQGFTWDSKKIIFTGLCALLWSIWLSRNDVVFHNTQQQTVLQILSGPLILPGHGRFCKRRRT